MDSSTEKNKKIKEKWGNGEFLGKKKRRFFSYSSPLLPFSYSFVIVFSFAYFVVNYFVKCFLWKGVFYEDM